MVGKIPVQVLVSRQFVIEDFLGFSCRETDRECLAAVRVQGNAAGKKEQEGRGDEEDGRELCDLDLRCGGDENGEDNAVDLDKLDGAFSVAFVFCDGTFKCLGSVFAGVLHCCGFRNTDRGRCIGVWLGFDCGLVLILVVLVGVLWHRLVDWSTHRPV